MLAIAAPSFHLPSETFIRGHVHSLQPSATVLICQNSEGSSQFNCPVLDKVTGWMPPVGIGPRIRNAFVHRWRAFIDPTLAAVERDRVVKFLREHEVKTLLVEYLNFGVLFTEAAEIARVQMVVHAHGYDASMLIRHERWRRHYRRLAKQADSIVVPSQYLADNLRRIGCPAEKLRVIPCGCDPHRFLPTTRERNLVVAVGRLVEKKGPELTIRSFAPLAAEFADARLIMIGDGPLMPQCVKLVRELGLENRVDFWGAQKSEVVRETMMRAALFVQHSITGANGDTEGLPVAILEAMACALPIVSTRHSGIPEAVSHRATGFLVEEGDVLGMSEAILWCLRHPDEAQAMGMAGRSRVIEHFTQDRTRERLLKVLNLSPPNS